MQATKYSIQEFIRDAKLILAGSDDLASKKVNIGQHLIELSKRDDLFRLAKPVGASDATTMNWTLYRDPPDLLLTLVSWFPGYVSPVHEHGDFWGVGAGYRGHDRWDMYERLDDGSKPGFADLRLVDQWHVTPGKYVCMPPPPRAIHSHNNMVSEITYELIFLGASPLPPEKRLIYDVESKTCWPTWRNLGEVHAQPWPPHVTAHRTAVPNPLAKLARAVKERFFCPVCQALDSHRRGWLSSPVPSVFNRLT